MEIIGNIWATLTGWLPDSLFSPGDWPPEAFVALVVLVLLLGAAYVWKRIGKGLLVVLILLGIFAFLVYRSMQ